MALAALAMFLLAALVLAPFIAILVPSMLYVDELISNPGSAGTIVVIYLLALVALMICLAAYKMPVSKKKDTWWSRFSGVIKYGGEGLVFGFGFVMFWVTVPVEFAFETHLHHIRVCCDSEHPQAIIVLMALLECFRAANVGIVLAFIGTSLACGIFIFSILEEGAHKKNAAAGVKK